MPLSVEGNKWHLHFWECDQRPQAETGLYFDEKCANMKQKVLPWYKGCRQIVAGSSEGQGDDNQDNFLF